MTDGLPLGGRLDGAVHLLPVRVYWEDTDAGGIVYHASYIRFMERGRTEFLRALGLDQSHMQASDSPVLFVVRHMATDYLRPAKLDDLLTVATRTLAIGGARLEILQTVTRGETRIAEARVTVVTVAADGRPCRIPERARALIATYLPPASDEGGGA